MCGPKVAWSFEYDGNTKNNFWHKFNPVIHTNMAEKSLIEELPITKIA